MLESNAVVSRKQRGDTAVAKLKIPPHSVEAECSVLGGLMMDSNAWDRVADVLRAEHFYKTDHQIIFSAMQSLANRSQPFDVITVEESLKNSGDIERAGGHAYLFELASKVPSVANITAYAEIVHERFVLRELITASNEIAEHAFNPSGDPSSAILDQAEARIFAISESTSRGQGPVHINKLLANTSDRIDELFHAKTPITGLATGFIDFDYKTSGLQRGDLIIVAGRPSMGKTAFAMNMAENAAVSNKDKLVIIFSMEMPGEQLTMRMISSLGRIDQHNLRTGNLQEQDWPRITHAISLLSNAKLFIDDTPALSPTELRSRARRLAREHGQPALIVIDYLQLMRVPGNNENRATEISEISRSLKTLAKELNVPVVALSQLNRGLEQRTDKRPIMSDLRESGAIEQDADVISFIYRDEVYNENSESKGIAEIIIGKQRNGPIGKVLMSFIGSYTRFENFAPNTLDSSH